VANSGGWQGCVWALPLAIRISGASGDAIGPWLSLGPCADDRSRRAGRGPGFGPIKRAQRLAMDAVAI